MIARLFHYNNSPIVIGTMLPVHRMTTTGGGQAPSSIRLTFGYGFKKIMTEVDEGDGD